MVKIKLTKNFSLAEMVKSQTAMRLGLDNIPNDIQILNATNLARNVLQPIRDKFGPFSPQSWFRSISLNDAVGGAKQSDHLKGMAADIEIRGVDNYDLACWIRDNLEYKQLILEYYKDGEPSSGWVHVSFDANEKRMEALSKTKEGWMKGIQKG